MTSLSLLLLAAGCRLKADPDSWAETGADECAATEETPYDGIDQDCNGFDLVDVDADGFIAMEAGGDDCDDANSGINPDAAEVPYDGIDQDCTGADLDDVDGDGHDAPVVGGDDCDDASGSVHPGAAEIPYDGIDQDCDGFDVLDVDGDGHLGAEVGGDDCDDEHAAVFPGAVEDESDGADNDCDGRVDERVVCWDGSGDFETIQDGVDGTADGGTVEICPGTYSEYVQVVDRMLTVEGGGESPGDVIIDGGTDGGAVGASGSTLSLILRNLALSGGDRNPGVLTLSGGSVTLDLMDFCNSAGSRTMYFEPTSASAAVVISHSPFCAEAVGDEFGISVSTGDDGVSNQFEFVGNVVEASAGLFWLQVAGEDDYAIHNNVLQGRMEIYPFALEDSASLDVYNNTFADGTSATVDFRLQDASWSGAWGFWNNIVSDMSDADAYLMTLEHFVSTLSGAPNCTALLPAVDSPNLIWRDANRYGLCTEDTSGGESRSSDSVGADVAAMFSEGDPLFTEVPGMGSYALGTGSPALDAGSGDSDTDGSAADLGAFGGPDGDWYLEVPWFD